MSLISNINNLINRVGSEIKLIKYKIQSSSLGKNLILNSKVSFTTTNYPIAQLDLSEDLIVGQEYIFTAKSSGATNTVLGLWRDEGYVKIGTAIGLINGKYTIKFTCPAPSPSSNNNKRLSIWNMSQPNLINVSDVKLEKGGIATDWSPAPEDVEIAINNMNTARFSVFSQTGNGNITVSPNSGFQTYKVNIVNNTNISFNLSNLIATYGAAKFRLIVNMTSLYNVTFNSNVKIANLNSFVTGPLFQHTGEYIFEVINSSVNNDPVVWLIATVQ